MSLTTDLYRYKSQRRAKPMCLSHDSVSAVTLGSFISPPSPSLPMKHTAEIRAACENIIALCLSRQDSHHGNGSALLNDVKPEEEGYSKLLSHAVMGISWGIG